MLMTIGKRTGISIDGQPFVGDSIKDVEAAIAAHCTPIIVRTGNGSKTAEKFPDALMFNDLLAFADWVVTGRQ